MSEVYDVLIIGAGPPGGMALIIDNLENYPGFPEGIAGYDLASKMEAQARKFGTNIIPEEVLNISGCGGDFSVKGSEKIYKARSVLVSTGSRYEKLRIPGEEELTGKGVSYCATCDGAFFRNRKVAVVGGGNSALQEALYLSRIASEVFLIHRRDAYRGSKLLQKRISENTKIKPVLDSIVTEIRGKDTVESIVVKNVKTEKESKIGVEGVFVAVGQKPNTAFCKNLLKMDEKGHIITAERSLQTSVEGVFVAGDCRVSDLRQVATAVGDGALVSESIDKYLQGKQ